MGGNYLGDIHISVLWEQCLCGEPIEYIITLVSLLLPLASKPVHKNMLEILLTLTQYDLCC